MRPNGDRRAQVTGALAARRSEPDRLGPRSRLVDRATEAGVLGGLILHPDLLHDAVAAGLQPENFARPGYGAVYRALMRLGAARSLNRLVSSVIGELDRAAELGVADGHAGVVGLMLDALEPRFLDLAIERLVMLARARSTQGALRQALRRVERDPSLAHAAAADLPVVE